MTNPYQFREQEMAGVYRAINERRDMRRFSKRRLPQNSFCGLLMRLIRRQALASCSRGDS